MIVKLDLRPESLKGAPIPKMRKTRLLMLGVFLVFGAAAACAWYGMVTDILFLRGKIDNVTNRIEGLTAVKAELAAELARLAKLEEVYVSSLSIMQQDLPTIEVFDAIDKSVADGVALHSLSLTHNDLRLSGSANIEDNVVDTARNLLGSGVFSTAQMPVVTRIGKEDEGLKFSLSLVPLSIAEVGRR